MAYHCQLSTVPISSSLWNRPGPLMTGNMEFAKVLITWEYPENPGDDMPSSKMWKPMTPTVASIIRHASDYGTLFSWNLLDREAGRPFWLYHLERTNTAIGAAIVVRATQATGHAVLTIANRHLFSGRIEISATMMSGDLVYKQVYGLLNTRTMLRFRSAVLQTIRTRQARPSGARYWSHKCTMISFVYKRNKLRRNNMMRRCTYKMDRCCLESPLGGHPQDA
jgi:hypothetical protein